MHPVSSGEQTSICHQINTCTTVNTSHCGSGGSKQESAAYATVSARQCRHLANTFEVAAIECLTWVLGSHLAKALELYDSSLFPARLQDLQPTIV